LSIRHSYIHTVDKFFDHEALSFFLHNHLRSFSLLLLDLLDSRSMLTGLAGGIAAPPFRNEAALTARTMPLINIEANQHGKTAMDTPLSCVKIGFSS